MRIWQAIGLFLSTSTACCLLFLPFFLKYSSRSLSWSVGRVWVLSLFAAFLGVLWKTWPEGGIYALWGVGFQEWQSWWEIRFSSLPSPLVSPEEQTFLIVALWEKLFWVCLSLPLFVSVFYLGLLTFLRPSLLSSPVLLQTWALPPSLVWGVILTGFGVVFPFSASVETLSGQVCSFLLSLYSLQGLSILCAIFHRWRLRLLGRWIGYWIFFLLFTPFLIGLGFFDLWFDFRSRFAPLSKSERPGE